MHATKKPLTYIDVFAGCGGLSLGLADAGFEGIFAIEKNECAFETLQANLINEGARSHFQWPSWLPKTPHGIEQILAHYKKELRELAGTVDLLAGGPPCQGFSSAGRRKADDPRNQLFRSYLDLVRIVKPKMVLMENVKGFTMDFSGSEESYSERLVAELSRNYSVYTKLVNVSAFGVPQNRVRYFVIGIRKGIRHHNPFSILDENSRKFLRRLGLTFPVSSRSAISDLEISRCGTRPSANYSGFSEINYRGPKTTYQRLMSCSDGLIGDLRLANHTDVVAKRFASIISECQAEGRLNRSVSEVMRAKFGIKKRALRVLDPDRPSPTVTSMPDDLLHYSEPRVLTVRENARLQSFPDWFKFKGKYTTGGERRRVEVPRYTQVANAVPPLAARAIGEMLKEILSSNELV